MLPGAVPAPGPADAISSLQVQVWFNLEIESNGDSTVSSIDQLVYDITVSSLSRIELGDNVAAEAADCTVDSLAFPLIGRQRNVSRHAD